jgi:DNA-binding NarL/FixJ family response regulator
MLTCRCELRQVVRLFQTCAPSPKASSSITKSQALLLKLFVEGHSQKSAASEMDVSFRTVSDHCRHIYEKLHVHSGSEAVSIALPQRML